MGILSRGGLIIILCSGCSTTRVDVGVGFHRNQIDGPEWQAENPVGIIKIEQPIPGTGDGIYLFYEHISSIPTDEIGRGLNIIGGTVRLK